MYSGDSNIRTFASQLSVVAGLTRLASSESVLGFVLRNPLVPKCQPIDGRKVS
jgi:hypothetical protein